MFKKTNRLAKTKDVELVFMRGRPFFNPYFTVKYLKKPEGVRFTVVVSTKVSKKAVERNRMKRVLRETIRLNLGIFHPGDYAVVVKPQAAKLPNKELVEKFKELGQKTRLFSI